MNHRQKVCPQCKGRVPAEASECLYCTADLSLNREQKEEDYPLFHHQSLEDSLSSTSNTPPSRIAEPTTGSEEYFNDEIAAMTSLYPEHETPSLDLPAEDDLQPYYSVPSAEEQALPTEEGHTSFLSILFLSLGANFLCLGLMLLLLGKEGMLSLSWKTTYWPLYCLLGLPLAYFGWRKLQKID